MNDNQDSIGNKQSFDVRMDLSLNCEFIYHTVNKFSSHLVTFAPEKDIGHEWILNTVKVLYCLFCKQTVF